MVRMQNDIFCFVAILIVLGNLQGMSYQEGFQLRLFLFYDSYLEKKISFDNRQCNNSAFHKIIM